MILRKNLAVFRTRKCLFFGRFCNAPKERGRESNPHLTCHL